MARQYEIGEEYTLELYPAVVWASATIRLQNTAGLDIVATTPATVTGATRDIAGGDRGADTIELAAGAMAVQVGRPYLAVAGGATQEVVPSHVDGLDVQIMQRLRHDATGGLLVDHRVSYTDTATADVSRAVRATWRSGAGQVQWTTLDFVRRPFSLDVTSRDVDAVGTLFGTLGDDYGVFQLLLNTAQEDIYAYLRGRGIHPDLVIERALLHRAATYRVAALRARDSDAYDRYQGEYQQALGAFVQSKAWVDIDDSGTKSLRDRTPPYYAGVS